MLTKEICKQSLDSCSHGEANVSHGPYSNYHGHSHDCGDKNANESHNKSKGKKNVQCFYCKKKGHIKKDCHKSQGKQKKKSSNTQDKGSTIIPKSNVKIEELNVVDSPSIETTHDVLVCTLEFSPNALIVLKD